VVSHRDDRPGPYLRFCIVVLYPLMRISLRHRWHSLNRIPRSGPAILVVNHISHVDPLVVGLAVWQAGRSPRYLAKDSLFHLPLIGRVFVGTGQIPVRRGSADASSALQAAVAALRRGRVVIVYPEGTVTRDPQRWPMQPKTGVARLALLAPDVPVIPLGQWGADEFLDVYHRRFRPLPRKLVEISVGSPVDLSDCHGQELSAPLLERAADRIMRAVRREVETLRKAPAPDAFFQWQRPAERRPPASERDH
jgi:1-acyl-sn-glycerol-3-phosphate acyltransferase